MFLLGAWKFYSPAGSGTGIEVYSENNIVNKLSNKCIQPVISDGYNKGTLLELTDCNSSFDIQQWEFLADGHIKNTTYNMCIDTTGSPGTENGARLQVWPCEDVNANPAQRWTIDSNGYIKNGLSGRCIDVPGSKGTASGAILQIWDCEFSNSSTDQRWTYNGKTGGYGYGSGNTGFAGNEYSKSVDPANATIVRAGTFVSQLSGLCLDPVGTTPGNGSRIQLAACDSSPDMYWELRSDGFIRNPSTGKCMDVSGSPGSANKAPITLYDCEYLADKTDQQWQLDANGFLQNLYSSRCVDIPGASSSTAGALTQLWDCEFSNLSTTDQRWLFKSAPAPGSSNTSISGAGASSPSGDTDGDRIAQAEETWIANAFGPRYIFDVEEPAKYIRFAFQVHPMTLPDGINQDGVILTIVTLYEADWSYPSALKILGYGLPEFKYFWHWGDNETIELWMTRKFGPCGSPLPAFSEQYNDPAGSARCYTMKRMILHSHSHTRLYEFPSPPGVMPVSFDGTLEPNVSLPGMRHPWVYISRGKHGAYIDKAWDCDLATYQGNISLDDWIGLVKMDEFCSDWYSSQQAGRNYIVQFTDNVNVGEVEEQYQLVNWMDGHPFLGVFPYEGLWDDKPFCGGNFTVFNPNDIIGPQCAGSNRSKWCGDPGNSYCANNPKYDRVGQ